MKLTACRIPGCFLIEPFHARDVRGGFVKVFQRTQFERHGLRSDFTEEYYSVSAQNVLRGMHFQTPPHGHVKVVHCLQGKILDAVVDLREGSPTYRQFETFELDAAEPRLLYLPEGLAHGFLTLSENATVLYRTTTEHAPANDGGILWNTAGIPWPVESPILSDRDRGFIALQEFKSPFRVSAT